MRTIGEGRTGDEVGADQVDIGGGGGSNRGRVWQVADAPGKVSVSGRAIWGPRRSLASATFLRQEATSAADGLEWVRFW